MIRSCVTGDHCIKHINFRVRMLKIMIYDFIFLKEVGNITKTGIKFQLLNQRITDSRKVVRGLCHGSIFQILCPCHMTICGSDIQYRYNDIKLQIRAPDISVWFVPSIFTSIYNKAITLINVYVVAHSVLISWITVSQSVSQVIKESVPENHNNN